MRGKILKTTIVWIAFIMILLLVLQYLMQIKNKRNNSFQSAELLLDQLEESLKNNKNEERIRIQEIKNDYIVRAVENNKDLKMATLTIDEYYQNIAMQRASELPSIQAGFLPGYGKIIGSSAGGFGLPIIANYELDLFGKRKTDGFDPSALASLSRKPKIYKQ